jgi:hypothetical protein
LYDVKAFVSPECKEFIRSQSQNNGEIGVYCVSEKEDIYSIGVLVYMMVTLTYDLTSLSKDLTVSTSNNFETYMIQHIGAVFSANRYSSFVLSFLIGMLHPNPDRRLDIENIMQFFSVKASSDKIEEEYNIMNKITEDMLVNVKEYEGKKNSIKGNRSQNNQMTGQDAFSMYLVLHKKTAKKYNMLSVKFQNENDAIQHYEDIKKYDSMSHDNLVPFSKIYLQRNSFTQFSVYILKVSIYFDKYSEA